MLQNLTSDQPIESNSQLNKRLFLDDSLRSYLKPSPSPPLPPHSLPLSSPPPPHSPPLTTSPSLLDQRLSLEELESLFERFSDSFELNLCEREDEDPLVLGVLDEEGCPICLAGSSPDFKGFQCALLRCKLSNCIHVFHTSCILQNSQLLSPSAGQPAIRPFHALDFLQVHPFCAPGVLGEGTPRNSTAYCISLEITHILSDIPLLKIDWSEPIHSHLDAASRKEFIILSLDENRDSLSSMENLPMFRAKRGKIEFTCTEAGGDKFWQHSGNYDIYLDRSSLSLVHVDENSQNTLTLGVRRERISAELSAFSLAFVRYDFAWEAPGTPMLQLSTGATPYLHQGDMLVPPSPLYGESSPFFVQNDLAQGQVLYKVEEGSPELECIEKSGLYSPSKITHNGQVFDFTPISSPINCFSLPSSHSSSILSSWPPSPVSPASLGSPGSGFQPTSLAEPAAPPRRPPSPEATAKPAGASREDPKKDPKKDPKPDAESAAGVLYSISIGATVKQSVSQVLATLSGQIFLLSKSQYGSRFIQDNLAAKEHLDAFYEQLRDHVVDLMVDNFGHYAFEALFAHCGPARREELLREIGANVQTIACHKQGSFSLQSVMDHIGAERLVAALRDALASCTYQVCVSCSGHYVMLRFLAKFGFPEADFLVASVSDNVLAYSTDHYGLRVVKALLDSEKDESLLELHLAIARFTNSLVKDQFGNYIIQHVLDVSPEEIKDMVKRNMEGSFVPYSKQKFSSNVVEKCLKVSSEYWQSKIVRELISSPSDLINDKYGNYCLQTALSTCNKKLTEEFAQAVHPSLARLRENVRLKWVKLLESAKSKHARGN